MSTETVTPAPINQTELLSEWLKAGKTKAQHVSYFAFGKFAAEYMAWIKLGRHIPERNGKHRQARSWPYELQEDRDRNALKARLMSKRSDWELRA